MKKVAAAALACASVATVAGGTPNPKQPFLDTRSIRYSLSVRGGGGDKDEPAAPPTTSNTSSEKDRKATGKKKKKRSKTSEAPEQSESSSSTTPQTPQEKLVDELLQEEDYYAVLGVSRTATSPQIQKAYRRRAVQTHPDKMPTGDRRAFDKVAEAYDVLSDDTKRATYDRFGKRGLEAGQSGGASHFHAEDLFRSFFGNQFGGARGPPRNRTVRYQLEVSLEDLYQGLTRTVVVTDPGRKKVEVHVPKGMASGQSILLSGEMDHIPDATPADLIFTLVQRPHPVFRREGHDLAMELKISLQEALCGVTRTFRHLDGRNIAFSSAHHAHHGHKEVPTLIQTGNVQVLKGEGMPKPQQHEDEGASSEFGDLYVQFVVEMPPLNAMNKLTPEEREQLGLLLEKLEGKHAASSRKSKDGDVRHLEKASTRDFGRASGFFRMEQDDIPKEDEGRSFPFGGNRHFYWSSGTDGGNPFSFGGSSGGYDDDQNVQCQHM